MDHQHLARLPEIPRFDLVKVNPIGGQLSILQTTIPKYLMIAGLDILLNQRGDLLTEHVKDL